MTPSSCREGLGSGWWAVAVAAGKGGEPRALAVPPLTHSPVETEIFPRLTPPALQHPSLAMAASWVGRVHLQTALPWQHPRHSTAWSRGLSWLGSAQPDAGAFSISPGVHSQAGWQPGAPARSSPQPREPQGHLCPGAPGTGGREQSPGAQCLHADTARIHGAAGQGTVGASPPPAWPTTRAFRAGRRAGPGRRRGQRDTAFSCQDSQRGAHGHQMHQTRCSHAATQGQLCQHASAGAATAEGIGMCPGGCSQAPCPTKHLA